MKTTGTKSRRLLISSAIRTRAFLTVLTMLVTWSTPLRADIAADTRDAAGVIDAAVLAATKLYGTEPFHKDIKDFLSLTSANLRAMAEPAPVPPYQSITLVADVPGYTMLIADILGHAATVNHIMTSSEFDPSEAAVLFKVLKDVWDVGWILVTKTGMVVGPAKTDWVPFLDGGLLTGAGAANFILGYDFFIVGQVLNIELSTVGYGVGIIHAGEEANAYARTLTSQSFFSDTERAMFNDYFAQIAENSMYRPLLELFTSSAGIQGYIPKTNYNVFDVAPDYGWFGMGRKNWTIAADARIVLADEVKKLQVAFWAYTRNTDILGDNSADGKPLPVVSVEFKTNDVWTSIQLGDGSNVWGVATGTAQKNTLYGPKCACTLEIPLPPHSPLPREIRTHWTFPNSSDFTNLTVLRPAEVQITSPMLNGTDVLVGQADNAGKISIPMTISSTSASSGLIWSLTPLNTRQPGETNSVALSGSAVQFFDFPTTLTNDQRATATLVLTFPTNIASGTYSGKLQFDALNASPLPLAIQVFVPAVGKNGYIFSTLAGRPPIPNAARFNYPAGVAADSSGCLYVADSDNHVIRKVTPDGNVTTLAGLAGSHGSADGNGSAARFYYPAGIALDSSGCLYIADCDNHVIRKVTPGGDVTTLAGLAGNHGSADGIGNEARFFYPDGVSVDAGGTVYIADAYNNTIRKMSPSGAVTTLAGAATADTNGDGRPDGDYADGLGTAARFYAPDGLAVDSHGNVFVADTWNCVIRKVDPTGLVTTLAGMPRSPGDNDGPGSEARFFLPWGVAVDASGNVYVSEWANHSIRKVAPDLTVSTLAGLPGSAGSADGSGRAARFNYPKLVTADTAGNLWVADAGNHTIRGVSSSGVVTTVAGLAGASGSADGSVGKVFAGWADGVRNESRFNTPTSLVVDNAGNVYVGDAKNYVIRKITPTGIVTTLAGDPGINGSADGAGTNSNFSGLLGLAVDEYGTLYVADTGNCNIRKVSPAGAVITLAGSGGWGANDGIGAGAQFGFPFGLAVDTAGDLYVADQCNKRIRKVTQSGVVSTLAGSTIGNVDGPFSIAKFREPLSTVIDRSGTVFVLDNTSSVVGCYAGTPIHYSEGGLSSFRMLSNGVVSTLSVVSNSYRPHQFAMDSGGNFFISGAGTIMQIDRGGQQTILAGVPGVYGSSDGWGSSASFSHPAALALDLAGNIYIADTTNHTIRVGSRTAAPIILGPFQKQPALAGAGGVISAPPMGLPPFSFQWFSNSVPIPDATTSLLTISNSQAYKVGPYSLVVSNAYGCATSVCAVLKVTTPSLATSLNGSNLQWSTGDVGRWFGVTDTTHDGLSAARAGSIAHNEQSTLAAIVRGPGTIRFWWKVSSEAGHDFLRFLANGKELASISGESGWTFRSITLPAGPQALQWIYSKDTSGNAGEDTGWVDEVAFVPPGPATIGGVVVANGCFQFSFQSDDGIVYKVEASTNLITWEFIATVTNIEGRGTFSAPTAGSCQFYRMKLVQ